MAAKAIAYSVNLRKSIAYSYRLAKTDRSQVLALRRQHVGRVSGLLTAFLQLEMPEVGQNRSKQAANCTQTQVGPSKWQRAKERASVL
jgi:hypothetical protein